ncbi:kinase-like protein [Teratosphaeria destructans]|uniref:non-specific serine/threonine protein kinase n=1 Tax=Teratosphaeria destructans TaxID=418781 RepID=A0A9W7SRN1_9PEZI|nr:kinase-like protein [Teratosphaeria destructans]
MQDIQNLKLTVATVQKITSQMQGLFTPDNRSIETNFVPAGPGDHKTTDDYQLIKMFLAGSEGQAGIVRNSRTNRVLVAKHCDRKLKRTRDQRLICVVPEEAKTLNLFKQPNPNIIRAFGCEPSHEQGRYFLYLEYCSGGDLHDQLSHFWQLPKSAYGSSKHAVPCKAPGLGSLSCLLGLKPRTITHLTPEIFVLHTFISLVQALSFIHGGYGGEAILHRDIKAENILLRWPADKHGLPDVVLADFGSAQLDSKSRGIAGTPGLLSPEAKAKHSLQSTDRTAYERAMQKLGIMTTKSDVYQLGHLMYHVTSCSTWKTGATAEGLEFPDEYREVAFADLERVVAWCLEVRPDMRPNADMLVDLLDAFRDRRKILAKKRGVLPRQVWKSPSAIDSGRRESRPQAQRASVAMPAPMPSFEEFECGVAF